MHKKTLKGFGWNTGWERFSISCERKNFVLAKFLFIISSLPLFRIATLITLVRIREKFILFHFSIASISLNLQSTKKFISLIADNCFSAKLLHFGSRRKGKGRVERKGEREREKESCKQVVKRISPQRRLDRAGLNG